MAAGTEVTMPDGTRCDLVTEKHAIEVDFADKWGEAIGQSLNYAFQSNKRAGILLILESKDDEKHLIRVQSIIEYYKLPIDVLAIRAVEEILLTDKKQDLLLTIPWDTLANFQDDIESGEQGDAGQPATRSVSE